MVERKEYLNSLIQWKEEQVIKVVTGIRRCGKSTLLVQYQSWLLKNNVSENQIISINFEELEYEELLDTVSSQTVAIDGLALDTKYGQFKTMLLKWVKTDAAVYLQNISAAILQNDSQKEEEALACRSQMYTDFLILSENMAVLGENVPGIDVSSLYEWSPENFISEVLEGVQDE